MKISLLILLAICSLSAAMVPRHRRSLADAEPDFTPEPVKRYCDPETPCAWSVYYPFSTVLTQHILNDYCSCKPDSTCEKHKTVSNTDVFEYLCMVSKS